MKTKHKNISGSLAIATASLLGCVSHSTLVSAEEDWEIDTSVLYYSETGRVSLVEPIIRARKDFGDESFLNFKLVIDTLTGSSANGAIPTTEAQTFTSASGNSTYSTPASEAPLDPNFRDNRVAISVDWEHSLAKNWRASYGLNYSNEINYESIGVSTAFNRDFNQKNSTLTFGLSYNADSVNPIGGIPFAMTFMDVNGPSKAVKSGAEDKNVYDILIGWTQVISRKDLMQFNFNYGNESGYLDDGYKILSVVDGTTGDLSANLNQRYVYEKRPDSRTRQAAYWRWSHQFTTDVFRLSYRYFWDDWGITSHTVDSRYRWEFTKGQYLEPHARYYVQSAADFYNTSLIDTEVSPTTIASADYRLADMISTTLGIKYGIEIGNSSEISFRAEAISQQADPSRVIGNQSNQDLVPDVNAVFFQLNYSIIF